jgi:hypothetical protein
MSQSNEPAAVEAGQGSGAASSGERERETGRAIEHRRARREPLRVRAVETIEHDAHEAWMALKKRPGLGVVLLGGLAVAAADAIGVGELAMGIAVGYGAYRLFFRREEAKPAGEGHLPAERVEHG